MYKTRLQELCQRKRWSLPKYSVEKKGLDHTPHFQATVTVNGVTFNSGDMCKSSKDAQKEAAGRAFNHFSVREFTPSEAPLPFDPSLLPGTSSVRSDSNMEFSSPGAIGAARLVKDNGRCKDTDREAEANMCKSKLNEFCQQNRWRPPDYKVTKKGPDHLPQFQAAVMVNDLSFTSDERFKSSKDAQSNAARLALDHFCTPNLPSSRSPIPSYSSLCANDFTDTPEVKIIEESLSATADLKDIPLPETLQLIPQKTNQDPQMIGTARHIKDDDRSIGMVRVREKTNESQELFPTMKETEHAAAKVALMSLSLNGVQEDESAYKNLLQELTQKECYGLPCYNTEKFGESHVPIFVSTVEVEGEPFRGREGKTKKLAEMSAARVAYMALKERMKSQSPNAHQGRGNLEFSSSSLYSEKTVNLQQNFEAALPAIPKEQHDEEIEVRMDPSSIQSPGHVGYSAVNDELSSSSANFYESDEDTEPPTRRTISSYPETSSSARVFVFPQSHPRAVPPGGTKMILNDEFVAYKCKPEPLLYEV